MNVHRNHNQTSARAVDVPLVFDVESMLRWADHLDMLSIEQVEVALGRVGRTCGPALLAGFFANGHVAGDVVRRLVGEVWSSAEYPDRALPRDEWRGLFAVAGFTIDGVRAPSPSTPTRLYRGSVAERRYDWSWTDDLDVAIGFAAGSRAHRPVGEVWTALVPPERLLARNTVRDESEFVVDTSGLVISKLSAAIGSRVRA